ncbi:MAG: hypothetical protein ACMUIU_10160 [bacterium]
MEGKKYNIFPYPMEPAHPMLLKLYDDLVEIYKFTKAHYQNEIDAAFDRASEQIGFVLTTTMPVVLEVGKNMLSRISIGSEQLKGTLFEKEISGVFHSMTASKQKSDVSPGTYNLVFFWYDAIKLRLKTDWMEPVHMVANLKSEFMGMPYSKTVQFKPWCEPAQWGVLAEPVFKKISNARRTEAIQARYEHEEPAQYLDPGTLITNEKSILVSAIDEVYPELRLAEKLSKYQYAMSPTLPLPPPGSMVASQTGAALGGPATEQPNYPSMQALAEVANIISRYNSSMSDPTPEPVKKTLAGQAMAEIANSLSRYGFQARSVLPGVREPAHSPVVPTDLAYQAFSELSSLLHKYGY